MSSTTNGIQEKTAHFSRTEILLLIVLFTTNWVVVTGTQMVPALFPALTRVFDTPLETVVLLSSILAFTGLLAPLFGPWADRYGHWFFLLVGLALLAAGNLACASATSFWLLLVFYGIVGIGRTILNVVITSYVGDAFAYAVRGRAVGMARSAISLALIAGVPQAKQIYLRNCPCRVQEQRCPPPRHLQSILWAPGWSDNRAVQLLYVLLSSAVALESQRKLQGAIAPHVCSSHRCFALSRMRSL